MLLRGRGLAKTRHRACDRSTQEGVRLMQKNHDSSEERPNRQSNMERAEGSRASGRESMRNRDDSGEDLGTSSDRAMYSGDTAEERDRMSGSPRSRERGAGSSDEKHSSRRAGGITNRDLDREESEQQQLPDRGRSQSER